VLVWYMVVDLYDVGSREQWQSGGRRLAGISEQWFVCRVACEYVMCRFVVSVSWWCGYCVGSRVL
jgi:hypothetical protein